MITVLDSDGFVESSEAIGTYNITIPQSQRDLYSGGVSKFSKSVSNFFDIKSRQYAWRTQQGKNNDKPYPVDTWRMLRSIVLDEKLEAVEGLVVDMINGGIGFRNHSVPMHVSQGAEWTEDLLWMEPFTECVDTNLTLEYTIPDPPSLSYTNMQNISLIDNGGFSNLIQQYPYLKMDDNQNNPKLRDRAYKAAWLVNVYAALIFNVTRPSPHAFGYLNSELGKKFPLADGSNPGASPAGVYVDRLFENLVDLNKNVVSTRNNTFTNQTETTGIYQNPWGISSENYSDINILCQGTGGGDYANSSNIQVQCGLFYTAAQRVDGKESMVLEPNSTWRQGVYTCATSNKVSLKTVSFRYNATLGSDLSSLNVLNVTEKTYPSKDDMPLWGIEQPEPTYKISDIDQLWGLVSDSFDPSTAVANNISLKRAPELYLPGYVWSVDVSTGFSGYEYNPAGQLPKKILATTYSSISGTAYGAAYDYTGATNLAMFNRWQGLSKNVDDVPTILNLIWTDLAANTFQGSKGWKYDESVELSKRDTDSDEETLVPVLLYRKRVQYRWVYGIPAFIVLTVCGLVLLASLVFAFIRQGPTRVRYYLHQLSAGRLLAVQHYPGQCNKEAETKEWIQRVGREIVDITQIPDQTPAFDQKVPMYDVKGENVNASTIELHDAYPLTPMTGRNHQGYVKMGNNTRDGA